jgi:hypothetical protein
VTVSRWVSVFRFAGSTSEQRYSTKIERRNKQFNLAMAVSRIHTFGGTVSSSKVTAKILRQLMPIFCMCRMPVSTKNTSTVQYVQSYNPKRKFCVHPSVSSSIYFHSHARTQRQRCSTKTKTTSSNKMSSHRALAPLLRRSVVTARASQRALRGGGTPPMPVFARVPAPTEPVSLLCFVAGEEWNGRKSGMGGNISAVWCVFKI